MLTTNSKLIHDNAKDEMEHMFPKDLLDENDAMKLFVNQMDHEASGEQKESRDEVQAGHEESTNNNNAVHNHHLKKLQQSSKYLKSPVLPRARALSKELDSIEDGDACWDLIATVGRRCFTTLCLVAGVVSTT
jgi:hypothetical protein